MFKISKLFQTLVGKIYIGYGILIAAFILNILLTSYIVFKNRARVTVFSSVIDPSLLAINQQKILNLRAQMLISKCVNTHLEDFEKLEIFRLLKSDFDDSKNTLQKLSLKWENEIDKFRLDTALNAINDNNKQMLYITQTLKTFDDYYDVEKKFLALDIFESKIIPNNLLINSKLEKISKSLELIKQINAEEIRSAEQNFLVTIILSTFIVIAIGLIFSYSIGKTIKSKLYELSNAISNLRLGKLKQIKLTITQDEIGLMSSKLMDYIASLKETTVFATKIGEGDFESDFKPLSTDDELGKSLLLMRNNLKLVKNEQEQRNWTSVGMAKFSEILSDTTRSTEEICDAVLSNLVKYTNSIQGSVFLIKKDDDTKENYFNLTASYAYDRKKFLQKRIEMGQGLVGQCFFDNDKIFLTDVPEDYINIKSGLGDSPPRCVLLVPIRQNNFINGVLELTTFYPYEQYSIEFIERIGENMGAVISTVLINENTRNLLSESQQHREELRAQEEEMRQNMEELMATQEEINRKSIDIDKIIAKEKKVFDQKEKALLERISELQKSNEDLINQIIKSKT
ncbi:MAG: GAF domain-containing protein [Bacteroidetes bacterium]|nr:MAG: GAF domain-containing protein [Bacteroidota bacterium]